MKTNRLLRALALAAPVAATGCATSTLCDGADEAWQRSLDIERADPLLFSTVVGRRQANPKEKEDN